MVKIVSDTRRGKATRVTLFDNGWMVCTQWGRHSRHFWIKALDADGFARDITSNEFGGPVLDNTPNAAEAREAHEAAIKKCKTLFNAGIKTYETL
jgi:hypothetical protein